MSLTADETRELARFPESLRELIDAELAAGNTVEEVGHSFPAAPIGAYFKFAQRISTRPLASGDGLSYRARNGASEFTDDQRFFFVIDPPDPPPPEADMDAIREAHLPKPGDGWEFDH
ncbi:MAG: hypothetical protein ABIT38_20750 [Gemmatimonadaceae bacterium]